MSQVLITTLNGAIARFFTLEPVMPLEPELKLVEQECSISPESSLLDEDLWADTKTGRNRGASGQAHSYDDHRQQHKLEFERRFAQSVTKQLLHLVQVHQVQELILVAEPHILGLMRDICLPSLPKQLKLNELARDLCHLKPQELHQYLAEKGQLPARRPEQALESE